jgi:hypothetical protein
MKKTEVGNLQVDEDVQGQNDPQVVLEGSRSSGAHQRVIVIGMSS